MGTVKERVRSGALSLACAVALLHRPLNLQKESYTTTVEEALATLYTRTNGVPRDILKVAGVAWHFNRGDGARITPDIVADAVAEAVLEKEPSDV